MGVEEFVAGSFAGMVGVCVGHPFDTVKVRLQVLASQGHVRRYRGAFDCFIKTIREESIFGLYKGLASPIFAQAVIASITFGVQSNTKNLMKNPESLWSHFVSGGAAGFAKSFVLSPTELAKIRIQMSGIGESHLEYRTTSHKHAGSLDCLYKVARGDGIRAVYKGLFMTQCREIPSMATYFVTYQFLCRWCRARRKRDKMAAVLFKANLVIDILCGGLAGVTAWTVCYPQDVIKSRIQSDGLRDAVRYANALDCLRQSYRLEGMRMFSEGLSSALLRAFPVNAATFATVAATMRYIHQSDSADVGSRGW